MASRENTSELYTVAQVAKALGRDPETIRQGIKAGAFPWGAYDKHRKSKRGRYDIYKRKFEEITGIIIKEEEND